ncbi:hypothetical protein B0H17DRAFT_1127674 [Mycena rosella]|uniref:Uncharacterized protein n=1 Tax=Mycena rosella TaxID=1033263 RepID=A0AAD7E0Y5_MYCRO|nr:hypothetical protein B0H17DRAFT_1127674 [Mycena rosella]
MALKLCAPGSGGKWVAYYASGAAPCTTSGSSEDRKRKAGPSTRMRLMREAEIDASVEAPIAGLSAASRWLFVMLPTGSVTVFVVAQNNYDKFARKGKRKKRKKERFKDF